MHHWPAVAIALCAAGAAQAQDRPVSQDIGSWVLACPVGNRTDPCELRHRNSIQSPAAGAPSASLEVIHRGRQFVPAITLRGLTTQAAVGGVLAVQPDIALRFDNAAWLQLACSPDVGAIVCAPPPDAAAASANQLANAHQVELRLRVTLSGGTALPEQSRTLDLQRTAEALAGFLATAPANESVPVIAGLDLRGFLDQLARDMGFQRGLADVLPALEGKLR